jgi:hypothetical protein
MPSIHPACWTKPRKAAIRKLNALEQSGPVKNALLFLDLQIRLIKATRSSKCFRERLQNYNTTVLVFQQFHSISKTKTKYLCRKTGLCLTDGSMHFSKLKRYLQQNPHKRLAITRIQHYPNLFNALV